MLVLLHYTFLEPFFSALPLPYPLCLLSLSTPPRPYPAPAYVLPKPIVVVSGPFQPARAPADSHAEVVRTSLLPFAFLFGGLRLSSAVRLYVLERPPSADLSSPRSSYSQLCQRLFHLGSLPQRAGPELPS